MCTPRLSHYMHAQYLLATTQYIPADSIIMETPRLLMTAGGKRDFSYQQGYEEIGTEELQLLLRLARQTVFSLETELSVRSSDSGLPPSVKNCVDKIQTTLQKLTVLRRVDDTSGLMSTAAKIMRSEQTRRREKIYKQFLIDVRDLCGAGTALLCSKGLGKRRIVDLNSRERVSLLSHLKANDTTFQHSILESYAAKLGITQRINADVAVDLPTTQSTESPAYRQRSLTPDVSAHDTPSVASLESRKRKWSPAQDQSMPIYEDKEQSQHHIPKTTCSQSRLSSREEPRPPGHDNRGEGQSSMRQSPQPATQDSCTNLVADMQPCRRIEYMYSNGPADRVNLSGTLFSKAIAASNQWEMERSLGVSTTGCITVLVPEGMNEDISITLWVSWEEGFQIVDAFKLTPAWSIPPKHQERRP